jgi:hypothetical protein
LSVGLKEGFLPRVMRTVAGVLIQGGESVRRVIFTIERWVDECAREEEIDRRRIVACIVAMDRRGTPPRSWCQGLKATSAIVYVCSMCAIVNTTYVIRESISRLYIQPRHANKHGRCFRARRRRGLGVAQP